MPPKGKLPDEVIEDFVQWIEMGAPDPRVGKAAKPQGQDRSGRSPQVSGPSSRPKRRRPAEVQRHATGP